MIDAEFMAFMAAIAKSQSAPAATVDTQVSGDSENAVQNKAIYNFVNSSVSTNTANFIGTFNSVEALEAYSGTVTNNDYAFVVTTDAAGNTVYNRYKYQGASETWAFEYALNNSSFTAAQWATIQSGLTAADKAAITTKAPLTSNSSIDFTSNGVSFTDVGTSEPLFDIIPDDLGISTKMHFYSPDGDNGIMFQIQNDYANIQVAA